MSDEARVPGALSDAVLDWYAERGRVLEFRGWSDPYRVLVVETMAQQTQIGRVVEAWARFVERFPSFEALAAASVADVLREWRGLGYNRRALNLHRTARIVVAEHGGRLPADVDALRALPGIGPYTARAVGAVAFGLPVCPVDTNVRRVLGRVVAGGQGIGARDLQAVADASVPAGRSAEWTHALMDVGATVCRPREPRCGACPASQWCRYARERPASVHGATRSPVRQTTEPPFPSTSRWLRGRLLDRLRDAAAHEWVVVEGHVGEHDAQAVARALDGLVSEGLAERHPTDPARVRLPA